MLMSGYNFVTTDTGEKGYNPNERVRRCRGVDAGEPDRGDPNERACVSTPTLTSGRAPTSTGIGAEAYMYLGVWASAGPEGPLPAGGGGGAGGTWRRSRQQGRRPEVAPSGHLPCRMPPR